MTDLVKHLRSTRANMIGTDDEQHYFDCHEAADYIEARESVIATLENRLNLLAVDRGRLERLEAFTVAVNAFRDTCDESPLRHLAPEQFDLWDELCNQAEALRELEAE